MADNTVINTGSGGDTIATDDLATLNGGGVSGVKVQRVKVGYGSDADLRDVDTTHPLPTTQMPTTSVLGPTTVGALNADVVASTDVSNYEWISLHLVTDGTFAGTISFQVSNDNTNWANFQLYNAAGSAAGPQATTTPGSTSNNLFHGPLPHRYVRVRLTAWTAGNVTGTCLLSSAPSGLQALGVDTELPTAAALTDTMANPTTPLVGAIGAVYDTGLGQAQRVKNIGAADGLATNVGIPAQAPVFWDGAAWRKVDNTHPLPARGGDDVVTTGSFTANGDSLVVAVQAGMTEWGAYMQGTYATGATVQFEASVDGGTVYAGSLMQRVDSSANVPVTSIAPGVNATRFMRGSIPVGATHIRMRVSAWAAPTGTINVRINQRFNPASALVGLMSNGIANPFNVQVGDGVDTATIIPRGTSPSPTDAGMAVVDLFGYRPTYQVVTTEITSATATGVKENLTLWHPNTVTKDVFILEIGVNTRVVQTAGTFAWELQFISAENATPGGTTITAQPLNLGDAASGLTIRQVPTGAPTPTGQVFQRAAYPLPAAATPFSGPSSEATILFQAITPDDAIQLRSGVSEGLRITQNIAATLTAAPVFTIYARYIERA